MSEEQLKAFMEAVNTDAGLQEKLKAVVDADAVVAIAKAAGFLITAEELQMSREEISEEEIEGVAGGAIYVPVQNTMNFVLMSNIVISLEIISSFDSSTLNNHDPNSAFALFLYRL